MKFVGKWVELENVILSEATQSQKNTHGMYSLISGYYPRSSEYPRNNSHIKKCPRRKEGNAFCPEKVQCSNVGEYKDRETGWG